MQAYVREIIIKQHLELEGGAELLMRKGHYTFASGFSIIPSLKNEADRVLAIRAVTAQRKLDRQFSRILGTEERAPERVLDGTEEASSSRNFAK